MSSNARLRWWAERRPHESGVGVIDQTRHEQPGRKGAPEEVDVDPDRGVRVADGFGVEVADRISKNSASISGSSASLLIPQSVWWRTTKVGRAATGLTSTFLLAQLGEQPPRAQNRRRNAAADVAHHDRLSKVETENMARVDPGIDATEDPQRLIAREREASESAGGGEPSVALDQFVGGDGHGHGLPAPPAWLLVPRTGSGVDGSVPTPSRLPSRHYAWALCSLDGSVSDDGSQPWIARERRLCRRSSPPGLHRNAESLEFRATVLLSLGVSLALIPLAPAG
ncbi:MAG: hypothetical protein WAN22_35655 [Solirubrobacteraceae bacterium]